MITPATLTECLAGWFIDSLRLGWSLFSRKWSNKTLTDHRADRRAWVLEALGLSATENVDPNRYTWKPVSPGDPNLPPLGERLLLEIANRQRWRSLMTERQHDLSAIREEVAA